MHYELQWAAVCKPNDALSARVDPVRRPGPCSRQDFRFCRSGQCGILWRVLETRKTTQGAAAAKDVLPIPLSARLTLVRVVVQMEDRAVCTEDVELRGLRCVSKFVVLAVQRRHAAYVQICGCL